MFDCPPVFPLLGFASLPECPTPFTCLGNQLVVNHVEVCDLCSPYFWYGLPGAGVPCFFLLVSRLPYRGRDQPSKGRGENIRNNLSVSLFVCLSRTSAGDCYYLARVCQSA